MARREMSRSSPACSTRSTPPRKLVFTWGWLNGAGRNPETVVTLTFTPRDGGTDLELVQTGFLKEEFRARHIKRAGPPPSMRSSVASRDGRSRRPPGPTLVGDPRSSYLRAARIAFEEKGVAYEMQALRGRIPPKCWRRAPLGQDAGAETRRELDLRDQRHSALHRRGLSRPGADARRSARPRQGRAMDQRLQRLSGSRLRSRLRAAYVFPSGPDGKPDRAKIEAAVPAIRKGLAVLEAGYAGRDYLVGDALRSPTSSRAGDRLFADSPKARSCWGLPERAARARGYRREGPCGIQ